MAYGTRFNLMIFISLIASLILLVSIPSYGDDNKRPGTLKQKKTFAFPKSNNSNLPEPVVVKPGERLPGTGMQSSSQKGPSALPGTSRIKSYSFPQPGGDTQQSSRNSTSSQTLPQVKLMAPYSFPRVNVPSELNNSYTQLDPYTVRSQYYQIQTTMPYNNRSTTYPEQQNDALYPGNNSYWNSKQNSAIPYTYNSYLMNMEMLNLYNAINNNAGTGLYTKNSDNKAFIYQFFRYLNSSGYPARYCTNPSSTGYPYRNSTNTNNTGTYYWRGQ